MQSKKIFHSVFIEKKPPQSTKIKELIFWGKILSDLNMLAASHEGFNGNLSFRHFGGCVLSTKETHLKNLAPDDFIEVIDCQKKGEKITMYCKGKKAPSPQTLIHFLIYQTRPDINSIMLGHDSLVMDKADELNIPQIKCTKGNGIYRQYLEIKKVLKRKKYLIIRNQGILSLGRTIKEAGQRALRAHERAMRKD
jgi:ribulose-5-phosphate 4-epimerase/fuculose-1-phosphate aldolase